MMKKFFIPLVAGLMAVSCVININGGGSVFVGSCTEEGIDFSEIRDVASFHSLSVSLPCNVYYVQADKQEVRVESTREFAEKVLTTVDDGVLNLRLEPGRYPKLVLRVVVSSPDIERISVSGSGNLIHEGSLHASGDLTLKVSGSGDIRTGGIDSKDFSAQVSGSGSLDIGGLACDGFSAKVSGSGGIAIQAVQAEGDASVRISGSGRVRLQDVTVDGDMDLNTSGSGGIRVNGSCHDVSATTSGSGSISGNLTYNSIHTRTSGSGRVNL